MKIGEVAKCTGVSVDALRFYEEKGLLQPTGRTESGYRQYAPAAIDQVAFIKSAQALGFSLQEIVDVMPSVVQGVLRLHEVRQLMQDKLTALDQQIERLQRLRHDVVNTMAMFQCDDHDSLNLQNLAPPKP